MVLCALLTERASEGSPMTASHHERFIEPRKAYSSASIPMPSIAFPPQQFQKPTSGPAYPPPSQTFTTSLLTTAELAQQ